MDELINLVSQRTGLPADQAQAAVQTVIGFLKDRLPGPLGAELESLISSGSGSGAGSGAGAAGALGELGSLAKGLGGMFGGTQA